MSKISKLTSFFAAFLFLSVSTVQGRNLERKFELTGGIEWGYTATIGEYYHYNYIADEGMRFDAKDWVGNYFSNGHILAKAGARYCNHFDTVFCLGYCGVRQERQFFTYSIRETIYWNNYRSNGFYNIIEAGTGKASTFKFQPILLGKTGIGYRFKINDDLSLDSLISFQICQDHPKMIIDRKTDTEIYYFQLRRSDLSNPAVNFSISLCF